MWLVDLALVGVGWAIGIWWAGVMWLPLLYGLPRAAWWVVSGRVRWYAPLAYLVAPMVWAVIFGAVAVMIFFVLPRVAEYLLSNRGFALGQFLGVIQVAGSMFFGRARQDADGEFRQFMGRYMKDPAWMHL